MPRRGATVVEMLVLLLCLSGMGAGVLMGIAVGGRHGVLGAVAGAILGAAAGIAGTLGLVFLAILPLELVALVRRVLQPAVLDCTCGRPAAAKEECPIASLGPRTEDPERLALAAYLEPTGGAAPPPEPAIRYDHWAKLPEDLRRVLRSGLPPRLGAAWALGCAQRALRVFEAEYHEEERPRRAFEAAVRVVREPGPASASALDAALAAPSIYWREGCRVLRRSVWDRAFRRISPGTHAAEAVSWAARSAQVLADPSDLWIVHSPGGMSDAYATPESRCARAQPCLDAEAAASSAALAAPDPAAETAWQRSHLASLILGWESWELDREAWRISVEERWIPRVRSDLREARFDVEAFVARIRRELVPWGGASSRGPCSGRGRGS